MNFLRCHESRNPSIARGRARYSYACSHAVTRNWCSRVIWKNGHWSPETFTFQNTLTKMWVFKCFLSIIYLILYLKSAIVLLFQQFRRLYFSVVSQPCSFGKIREDSKGLTKLPRHISFVVLESHISFADVAQLVVWSMAMGIPFISVYDRQGSHIYYFHGDAIHSNISYNSTSLSL